MDKTTGVIYRRIPAGTSLLENDLRLITDNYTDDRYRDEFLSDIVTKLYGGRQSNLLSTLITKGSFDYRLIPIEAYTNIMEQNTEHIRRTQFFGYLDQIVRKHVNAQAVVTNVPYIEDDPFYPVKYVSELPIIINAIQNGIVNNVFGKKELSTKEMLDLYWLLLDFVKGFELNIITPLLDRVTGCNEEDNQNGLLYLCNKGNEIEIILN